MSDNERYGQRDMVFSRWHRSLDKRLKFLDIDWVEFCDVCSEPLAVVEIAQDVGQDWKPTTVLERIAKRSKLPAFCILYQVDSQARIAGARVRRVFPKPTQFKQRSAAELERLIERVHDRCCRTRHNAERHEAVGEPEVVPSTEETTVEYWEGRFEWVRFE